MQVQTKLLKVLEEKRFRRMGVRSGIESPMSTHRRDPPDLHNAIREKKFRTISTFRISRSR